MGSVNGFTKKLSPEVPNAHAIGVIHIFSDFFILILKTYTCRLNICRLPAIIMCIISLNKNSGQMYIKLLNWISLYGYPVQYSVKCLKKPGKYIITLISLRKFNVKYYQIKGLIVT